MTAGGGVLEGDVVPRPWWMRRVDPDALRFEEMGGRMSEETTIELTCAKCHSVFDWVRRKGRQPKYCPDCGGRKQKKRKQRTANGKPAEGPTVPDDLRDFLANGGGEWLQGRLAEARAAREQLLADYPEAAFLD